MGVVLATARNHISIFVLINDFVLRTQKGGLDKAIGLEVVSERVSHRVERVVVHDEIVRVILLHTSHHPPKVMWTSNFQSISQPQIVTISVVMRYDSQKTGELWHHCKNAH